MPLSRAARGSNIGPCPNTRRNVRPDIEEIAEAYCMEKLDHSRRIAFENHYLICPRCASIVASTDEYIRSMKAALKRIRSQERRAW